MAVIVPLYGLGMIVTMKGQDSVRTEIAKSLESRVSYYLRTLETEVGRMVQLQQEFIVDKDLQNFMYVSNTMSRLDWGNTILRIQNKLQLIKSSSVYIENASAQLLGMGRSISSNSAINDVDRAEIGAIVARMNADRSQLVVMQDKLYVGLQYPESMLLRKDPDYMLLFELSVAELRKALRQFTNYERSGAVLLNPDSGFAIAGNKDDAMIPQLRQFLADKDWERTDRGVRLESMRVGAEKYLVSYQYSTAFNTVLMVYLPEEQALGNTSAYRDWFWLLSLAAMLLSVAFSYWIYRLIHKPLHKLLRNFRRVEGGDLAPAVLPRSHDEFHHLFDRFNSMVSQIAVLIRQLSEEKVRAQTSELKQLQSQINPHFLYNTFFILYRFAKLHDIDSVITFCKHLGQYFQFITRSGADEVPLELELNHARIYVEIQQIRFSNRIEVEFDPLPEAYKSVLVPRLIVQPLIENAYKYGMEQIRSDGTIAIRIVCGSAIVITVEDNGSGMDDEPLRLLQEDLANAAEEGEMTGIRNVHRRLQLKFGGASGIRISPGERGGLKVEMTIIPKEEINDVQFADRR